MVLGMGMMLALVGVCNYYIVKRLQQSVSYVFPKVRKGVYIGLFILLTLLLVMGFARSSLPLSDGYKHTLGLLSFYWMGLFVYLLLFFWVADLVLLICRLFKLFPKPLPHKHRAIAGALAVVLALGTSCYGWNMDNFFTEVNTGTGKKFPLWMKNYIRFGIPVILIALWAIGIVKIFV